MGKINRSIYVMLNENGEVKIGVSQNIEQRKNQLESITKTKIVDIYHTDVCENSFEIEAELHEYFAKNRIEGEWFDCSFIEAVKVAQSTFRKNAIRPIEVIKSELDKEYEIFSKLLSEYSNHPVTATKNESQNIKNEQRRIEERMKVIGEFESLHENYGDLLVDVGYELLTMSIENSIKFMRNKYLLKKKEAKNGTTCKH